MSKKFEIIESRNLKAKECAESLIAYCNEKKGAKACLSCVFHKAGRGCSIDYPMNWGLRHEAKK